MMPTNTSVETDLIPFEGDEATEEALAHAARSCVALLRNKDDWERQATGLQLMQRLAVFSPETLAADPSLYKTLLGWVVRSVSSLRSALSKRAAQTLSELFARLGPKLNAPLTDLLIPALMKRASDNTSGFIRQHARAALHSFCTKCGSRDVVRQLVIFIQNSNASLREIALLAIHDCLAASDQNHVHRDTLNDDAMRAVLQDANPRVRKAAAQVQNLLANGGYKSNDTPSALLDASESRRLDGASFSVRTSTRGTKPSFLPVLNNHRRVPDPSSTSDMSGPRSIKTDAIVTVQARTGNTDTKTTNDFASTDRDGMAPYQFDYGVVDGSAEVSAHVPRPAPQNSVHRAVEAAVRPVTLRGIVTPEHVQRARDASDDIWAPVPETEEPSYGGARSAKAFAAMFARSPLHNSKLQIVQMSNKTFGAEVYGFDAPTMARDAEMMAKVRAALEEHLVLRFHNVAQDLTPALHVDLAKRIGPVDPQVSAPPKYLLKGVFNSPEQVKRAAALGVDAHALGETMRKAAEGARELPREITRIVKEPSDVAAFGEGWHSDLTYLATPPFAAALAARELPSLGLGNTMFLDMRAAFDTLPEDLKVRASGASANHTDGHQSWTVHPAVRVDNMHSRPSLFVNKAFARHMVPRNVSSDSLLTSLLAHVDALPELAPQAFLDLTWTDGQLLMWDNRFTQHAAVADYHTRREMHRVIVSGNAPF
ncbi:Alpha-ketoglutarate-dependent sulfonate dioxygenase [Hondaea fermentalgiana]|uniref:Alpha-ketoglutarate-dependent sulfonate dioxygenase n=1 Tax=Hondaea fermentalgiana TaxID=2315210 RepID=A0A2R5GTN6_9STRA|nr:Alpha-ketoglutarate-dependent sulfonate dioxygenase [Hondaea fermentalgiana]|eukprot:GBG34222.1 Alpha-ketoglutarate-dependent sulfonate dioxygenase [Hondaea fermentalgiana]